LSIFVSPPFFIHFPDRWCFAPIRRALSTVFWSARTPRAPPPLGPDAPRCYQLQPHPPLSCRPGYHGFGCPPRQVFLFLHALPLSPVGFGTFSVFRLVREFFGQDFFYPPLFALAFRQRSRPLTPTQVTFSPPPGVGTSYSVLIQFSCFSFSRPPVLGLFLQVLWCFGPRGGAPSVSLFLRCSFLSFCTPGTSHSELAQSLRTFFFFAPNPRPSYFLLVHFFFLIRDPFRWEKEH